MNDDDFTTAARTEADRRMRADGLVTQASMVRAHGFTVGAVWARDHLAAQEISHEEVIGATLEMYVRSHQLPGRQTPFESLDHEEQVSWVKDGRAVLSAARAARRDEKDKP